MSFLSKVFSVNTYIQAFKSAAPKSFNRAGQLSDYFGGIARTTFENGLRANIQESSDERLLSLKIKVRSGSDADPVNKQGIAHFLEHMIFSQNDEVLDDIDGEFRKRGGMLRGVTRHMNTEYEFRMPYSARNLRFMKDKILPAVFNPAFDAQQVEYEKNVVENEHLMYEDEVRHNASESVRVAGSEILYGVDTSQIYDIGDSDDIKGFSVEDLQDFHRRYYVPNNIEIDVSAPSGTRGSIFRVLKEQLSGLQSAEIPKLERAELIPGEYHRQLDLGQRRQAHYAVFFPMPELDKTMQGSQGSVLWSYLNLAVNDEFRGKTDRKAYHNGWRYEGFRDKSSLMFTGNIMPEDAGDVLPTLAKVVSDIAAGNIDEDRLRAAKEISMTTQSDLQFMRRGRREDFSSSFQRFENRHRMRAEAESVDVGMMQRFGYAMTQYPPRVVTAGASQNMQSYDEFAAMLPLSNAAKEELSRMAVQTEQIGADQLSRSGNTDTVHL